MEYLTLNNGVKMPLVGFGSYKISDPKECQISLETALDAGYRLIDTAQFYGNEAELGEVLSQSRVPRGELFLTTKVWFRSYSEGVCRESVLRSMEKLKTDYLDLVLLHWPFGDTYAAWRDLEKLYEEKKIRAIGISNFDPDRMIDFIHFQKICPAVNQIETHLFCQRQEEHKWMEKYHIAHQAYTPLGRGKTAEIFGTEAVRQAAEHHGKTPAQITLRFLVQRGISVIPKSAHPDRIRANIDLFDFALTPEEMAALEQLDTKEPMIGRAWDPDKVEIAMTW